jgi:flagellar basal-body rod protein FlgB
MRVLDGLFDSPGALALERRLALLDAQRGAIAANLANADTPGYRPVTAVWSDGFAPVLGRQLRLGETPGAGSGTPAAVSVAYVPESPGPMKPDGNGVDVDAEMARLARTQLWYSAGSRLLQLDFQRLRTAIDSAGG